MPPPRESITKTPIEGTASEGHTAPPPQEQGEAAPASASTALMLVTGIADDRHVRERHQSSQRFCGVDIGKHAAIPVANIDAAKAERRSGFKVLNGKRLDSFTSVAFCLLQGGSLNSIGVKYVPVRIKEIEKVSLHRQPLHP